MGICHFSAENVCSKTRQAVPRKRFICSAFVQGYDDRNYKSVTAVTALFFLLRSSAENGTGFRYIFFGDMIEFINRPLATILTKSRLIWYGAKTSAEHYRIQFSNYSFLSFRKCNLGCAL